MIDIPRPLYLILVGYSLVTLLLAIHKHDWPQVSVLGLAYAIGFAIRIILEKE